MLTIEKYSIGTGDHFTLAEINMSKTIISLFICLIISCILFCVGCQSHESSQNNQDISRNPPLIPRWAFEPWVWEDNGNKQSDVLALVDGYRNRNIPVGAVIIDSPWSTGYNDFIWDTKRYPEPQAMIDKLHQDDVRVIMWMTGNINGSKSSDMPSDKSSNFDEAVSKGYGTVKPTEFEWWKGTGIHVDVTNSEARKWFASQLDKVMNMGVDGFKCDEGVAYLPKEITTAAGPMTLEDYKFLWYKYMADYATSKNPAAVITARPYSWQHGPVHAAVSDCILGWCGDFEGDYAGIMRQMDNLYRSAQAGYSGLQVEVGGYFEKTANKAQLIRYAQFGALMPSMSNGGSNGGLTNHLPWWQDQQNGGSETTDIYRYFATLHSELVPYIFSLGVEAHLTGKPIVRQADIMQAKHILGEDILVGVMDNDSQKQLNLPEGQWVDFWDRSRTIAGNQTLSLTLPLNRYPIYFRNGAIIPANVCNNITGHGDADSAGKTTLLIFPSGIERKTFYRPVGDGVDYTKVDIEVDAVKGAIKVDSQISHDWILRIQVADSPEFVKGADKWYYDTVDKVIIVHKKGSDFKIAIEGLSII